jgi:hypothetical protein
VWLKLSEKIEIHQQKFKMKSEIQRMEPDLGYIEPE